jgi:hypothetical protein
MVNHRQEKKLTSMLNQEIIFRGDNTNLVFNISRDCWYSVSSGGRHRKIESDYVVLSIPEEPSSFDKNQRKIHLPKGPIKLNINRGGWYGPLPGDYSSLPSAQAQQLDNYVYKIIQERHSCLEDSVRNKYPVPYIVKRILRHHN